jgi:hypothetical protein
MLKQLGSANPSTLYFRRQNPLETLNTDCMNPDKIRTMRPLIIHKFLADGKGCSFVEKASDVWFGCGRRIAKRFTSELGAVF